MDFPNTILWAVRLKAPETLKKKKLATEKMQIKTTAHLKCGVLNRTKRDPEFSLELKYIVLSLYDILFIYLF